jgi:aconitate hydratase
MAYPRVRDPEEPVLSDGQILEPPPPGQSEEVRLVKGPNIASLPSLPALPDSLRVPVVLKLGDDVSTDEIMPAGARVLPLRSNIPEIARFCFGPVDETYHDRAMDVRKDGGHALVAGANYGQGSSREHAALAPGYLGLRVVLARGFARIHWQNLVNFGVLPLSFADQSAYDAVEQGDVLVLRGLRAAVREGRDVEVVDETKSTTFVARHDLSERQVDVLLAGGLVNWMKDRLH